MRIAQVVSVSNPQQQFPSYMAGQYAPPMETTVDVTVNVDGEKTEFKKLPSNGVIANSGNVVVSESKEAMCSEVEAMLRQSKGVLDSVDYHSNVVAACEDIISTLNPRIAKEKEQEQKILSLEKDVKGMKGSLTNIEGMLKKALGKA